MNKETKEKKTRNSFDPIFRLSGLIRRSELNQETKNHVLSVIRKLSRNATDLRQRIEVANSMFSYCWCDDHRMKVLVGNGGSEKTEVDSNEYSRHSMIVSKSLRAANLGRIKDGKENHSKKAEGFTPPRAKSPTERAAETVDLGNSNGTS